ncbi:MAG: sigma 54-interacting transcriptional regulator [Syntrophomonadaceae bacterium]|jgi:transcriptional regulator with PAS, ATPase and Fis domain|nr:sigma 54-interacting transcriptional regulator [Syntrophomonadaceae bacterium]
MDTVLNNDFYWIQLHENPKLLTNLNPEIRKSWVRSSVSGISPYLQSLPQDTESVPETQAGLILAPAKPIAEQVLPHLPENSAILLFDQKVRVRDIIASRKALKYFAGCGIVTGALFAENAAGTNAAALGFILGRPVQVLGHEHFCHFWINYTTSFAPITDHQKVIGGICILGPKNADNQLLLGMAKLISQSAGSKIAFQKWSHKIDKAINKQILFLDADYNIFWISQQGREILNCPEQSTYSTPLAKIIVPDKLENHHFWNAVRSKRQIDNEAVIIKVNNRQDTIHCRISITDFEETNGNTLSKMIIFQETEKMNRLPHNYYENNAKLAFDNVIGTSPVFVNAVNKARLSSKTLSNILLLGESGTGKDVLAKAIHNSSLRKDGPFITVNCAALTKELIFSELFGYDEGAFTGAKRGGNTGKFELAHQGTIFLDEIGDMPIDLQVALLRVIEEKHIMRLGGNKSIPIDIRIISATNKNLEYEIAQGHFRHDLYYRLGVIKIHLPSLREHPEDILPLSEYFLNILCQRFNMPRKTLAHDALNILRKYPWPGNVRELQNVLESAVQWSANQEISNLEIEPLLSSPYSFSYIPASPDTQPDAFAQTDISSEKDLIQSCLTKYDNNKAKTARVMGISRKTLYKRLQKYCL